MNPSAPPFQPPPAGGFPLLPPALPSSTGFLPPPGTTNSAPRPLFPPPTTTTTAEASDIPTALSALTSLLLLSQNSLDSLSGILPTASPSPTALIPCPFNPSHRLPPPPLFNHSLHCIPSSSSAELDSLIQSCSYPHNLHSSAEGNDTLFNQSLNDPEVELCFSVESYSGFDRNGFLYSDCPEVVMRDVIEEYMEIIKQTGGVENLTKGEETYNDAKSNKSQLESSLTKEHTHQYTKDSHSLREAQSSDFRDGSSKEKTQDRCNYSHITVDADRSAVRNGRSRLDCSRSPDRSTTYKSKHTSLRRQGDREAYEEDFYHSSSRKHQKSYDRSIHKERVDHRRRRKTEAYNDHTSVSTLRNEFDDRYDPSESRDSL
ncbi:unnamed protein product [Cuscuta campestris]|uniref:CHHC U11-48K-type domain-containing protein n=1 Tax=Cuscuta campestris TaxID=132261 RepID=A0A484KHR4_9ASTE|nr:unnamed protein product [Cuscuta campestris]